MNDFSACMISLYHSCDAITCMEGTEVREDKFVQTALLLQQHMSWFGRVGQVLHPDSIVVLSWLYISSIE